MGPNGGPEASVNNHKSSLPNIPEDRRSHLHRGERLKSKTFVTTTPLSDDNVDQCFSTAGSREILLELITNLNVILYLSTSHTVHIIVLILFMIMS